ncbi:MAG: pyruvate, orthophosphate dikinase [Mycobacterium sp.]|nr:pyruvate, orthophosphate dikinase [Mycobacterium sp.]
MVLLDGTCTLSREMVGNKGYGINLMRGLGLPVPPAFCVTTEACAAYLGGDVDVVTRSWPRISAMLSVLEGQTSRTFGCGPSPLMVSVRSGAAQSMPGMLDTVLNLGIDDDVHQALAVEFDSAFADDVRSRFDDMYRRIVLGDNRLPDQEGYGDPHAQLRAAIEAVFRSWHSPRAAAYRAHHGIGDDGATAVVVQAMVFGNVNEKSGTGVLFSRNPMTGANEIFGEWLGNAQGEDVVSGAADCRPIDELRSAHPGVFAELTTAAERLETVLGDVQDIEFTVEDGRLWLLQTRTAKRSAQAAVRLALGLRDAGLIEDADVLHRVTPAQVRSLLSASLQPETRLSAELLASGVPATPGVASGKAYADVDAALDAADRGEDVILVRPSTSPEDVAGMLAARAIVTDVGGATSHAAVVSRELDRPAVVGCGRGVSAALDGRLVTVDGSVGEVRAGLLDLTAWSERDTPDLVRLAEIAMRLSPLKAHPSGHHPRLSDTSEAAISDALAEGRVDVVSDTPLVAMLTAFNAVRDEQSPVPSRGR